MLGIDTNVLVRYLVRDDEAQYEKSKRLIRREIAAGRKVLINQLVVMETEWVLRSRYGFKKSQLVELLSQLLDASNVQFEDEAAVEQALFVWKEAAADFADCLIGARNWRLNCEPTATFDIAAMKLPGFVAV